MLGELIRHRSFIWDLVRKEIRARYAGSLIGLFWAVLHPALTILIFFLIFSSVVAGRLRSDGGVPNFVIYLCCGILPWNAFNETATRASTVFLDHSSMIKRVLFPRQLLLAQIVLSTTLNLVIGLALFLLLMVLTGFTPGITVVWLPFIIFLQMLFSFGLGLALATLNVFFRDLTQVVHTLLSLWFWMTPIVYPLSILPQRLASLMKFNPLAYLVEIYRDLILYSAPPSISKFGIFLVVSALLYWFGIAVYDRLKDDLADML
jgi:lipopolysaccharide transport system permease protein